MVTLFFRLLIFLFAVALLVAVQTASIIFFIPESLNVLLIVTLYISIIYNYRLALSLGLFAGFLLDQVTYGYGMWSFPLITTLIITNALFIRFFTNRSLWSSLLLGNVGTIITFTAQSLFFTRWHFSLTMLVTQLIIHTFFLSVFFFLTHMLTNRLRPYILLRARDA